MNALIKILAQPHTSKRQGLLCLTASKAMAPEPAEGRSDNCISPANDLVINIVMRHSTFSLLSLAGFHFRIGMYCGAVCAYVS